MNPSITALVVANATGPVERIEAALGDVYDEVTVVVSTDEAPSPDCVVAVAPLAQSDWATVEAAANHSTRPPVVVLATESDAGTAREHAESVGATDVVVADGADGYRTVADRARGMVELRRSGELRPGETSTGTHLTALYEVATDAGLSFEEKAERMLEVGIDRLGVENAHLSTIEREPEHYEIVASVGELPMSAGDLMDLPTTFCRRTVETDEVLSFNNAGEQGWAGDPAYEGNEIECYLGSRIVVGGSLFGTVCFLDRSPHSTFTEAEKAFVSLIARWLSHELERTRRQEALETLHVGTTELMRATTKAGVCEVAVGIASDIVDGPLARAWLVDDAGTTLRSVASLGTDRSEAELSRGDDDGRQLWAALDGGEVSQSDDSAVTEADEGSAAVVRSEVVVPLDGRGVLTVASETADAFDAIDVSLLKMLGSNTVAALERTDRVEELTAAHARARRIFESASDGLLLVDPDSDEIIDCNDRAVSLLGYEDAAALQSVAPTEICREDPENYRALVDDVERSGRGWVEGLTCLRRDGKRIPTEVTAATIELSDRTGVLASLRDITDRKRREQALDVFNRVFRHNIRNDMNVIIGHASMIHDGTTDPDIRESAAEIRETGRALTDLGEKARTFRKFDDRETDTDSVDLRALLDRVGVALESEYPDATIGIEGPDPVPAAVESTVDIAIRELFENAIKHAKTAEPTVSVTIQPIEGDRRIAVDISDEGPGLPPQDCAVLEGESETPLDHGSGLGLWLANWVVGSNGGTVSVAETADTGTTIRLVFPAAPVNAVESTTD